MIQAAEKLGTHLPTTVMALAYGDELTNMLQPFWGAAAPGGDRPSGPEDRGLHRAPHAARAIPGFLILLALFGA